jgi:hypothetical protein
VSLSPRSVNPLLNLTSCEMFLDLFPVKTVKNLCIQRPQFALFFLHVLQELMVLVCPQPDRIVANALARPGQAFSSFRSDAIP